MKKEELIKLFPCISEEDIEQLPDELAVCWYPSSGSHFTKENDNWSGYHISTLWQRQSTSLKPNLFIFTDVQPFVIPPDARLLYSQLIVKDYITEFLELHPSIELLPHDHPLKIDPISAIRSYSMLARFLEKEIYLPSPGEDLRSQRVYEKRIIFQNLLEASVIKKEDIEKERENVISRELLEGPLGIISKISIIEYMGCQFILVQASNETLYSRLIGEKVKVPMLTVNRPMDPFIEHGRISLEELGVRELIGGQAYVSGMNLSNFKKFPDFIFQKLTLYHGHMGTDLANFYSLL
jgi:hypothetical protein